MRRGKPNINKYTWLEHKNNIFTNFEHGKCWGGNCDVARRAGGEEVASSRFFSFPRSYPQILLTFSSSPTQTSTHTDSNCHPPTQNDDGIKTHKRQQQQQRRFMAKISFFFVLLLPLENVMLLVEVLLSVCVRRHGYYVHTRTREESFILGISSACYVLLL
jgi:hypothetical protein